MHGKSCVSLEASVNLAASLDENCKNVMSFKTISFVSLAKIGQRFTDCDKKPWYDMLNISISRHGH